MSRVLCVSFLSILAGSAAAQFGFTERVSLGAPLSSNADTDRIAVSQAGTYIVYESLADNIVGGDTNGARDIFLYEWATNTTEIISVTGASISSNGDSFRPEVTADGRFVVFSSAATNLVAGDTNGVSDIFVRDRQTQTTFRVSVTTSGVQSNGGSSECAISDNGDFAAFVSSATNLVVGDTNGVADAFLYDLNSGATTRVSLTNGGAQSNASTSDVEISGVGSRIVFSSGATNLVAGDTNGAIDVFMRDRLASTTTLLSRSTGGTIGNGTSRSPSINFSGDRVVFRSSATNLVAGDTNGVDDVFLRRVDLSETARASTSASGVQGNAASLGGSISQSEIVVFQSTATNLVAGDTNAVGDVFRKNLSTGEINRISVSSAGVQGNGASGSPAASSNLDVFISSASNLVAGDSGGFDDGFARFAQANITFKATSTGQDPNLWSSTLDISDSGRYIIFASFASNLVEEDTNGHNDIFIFDLYGASTQRVSISNSEVESNNASSEASVSADGRYIAFSSFANNLVTGDTNVAKDVFVRDILGGTTRRVSISSAGAQGNGDSGEPSISVNGRYVAFSSSSSNLVAGDTNATNDVFVHDLETSQTVRVSLNNSGQQGGASSGEPAVSGDGSLVSFSSLASNLVSGDTNGVYDVFVRNRNANTTERVSVSSAGAQGHNNSYQCDMNADGSAVAFTSSATNLVVGDTNSENDIFVRNRNANTTVRASVTNAGAQANNDSNEPSISADGMSVGFQSLATNLVSGDTNAAYDCFIRSLALNKTRMVSVATTGEYGNGRSERVFVSSDGLAAVFDSSSTNLELLDRNDEQDIFLNDARILSDAISIVRGVEDSGGQGSLLYSDGIHYAFRPGITFTTSQAPIEIVANAFSPLLSPTRLEFAIEFHSTSGSIRETIELYNFDTNAYELVDTRQSTTLDAVVVIPVTSNPGKFVSASGEIRTRLKYKPSGPVLTYPWRTRIDHVRWTVFN